MTRDSMAAPPLTEYLSVAGAVDELGRRGFTEGLRVIDGGLRPIGTGEPGRTEDLLLPEAQRCDGTCDPDDLAIPYGLEGPRRLRATVLDAFGVSPDPGLIRLTQQLP